MDDEHIELNSVVTLTGQNARHLSQVLRLKPGSEICLLDGSGSEFRGTVTDITPGTVLVKIDYRLDSISESPIRITLAQAFLKDKKMDTLIRMLTELGIHQWIPFQAARSVAKPDAKRLASRHNRWETIAKESLKQCRRSHPPLILNTVSFDEMLEISQSCSLKILFYESEPTTLDQLKQSLMPPPSDIFIMIGPEGGFTDHEVSAAKEKGFITASLGPRILKAETATIAAASLVQYIFGDMG